MSAAAFDPEWGDDLMAIADATREASLPHPEFAARFIAHPSMREEFTDLALELTLLDWTDEVTASAPIALVPTDHDVCHGCAEPLCGCPVQCDGLDRDNCGHWGRLFCETCAPHHCADCQDEKRRWERAE